MNKLIMAIALSVCTLVAQADVQVQIDPSPVTVDATFQLTLTQAGSQAAGVPDLRILQKDFLILGTARQVSYSVVNGQSSMSNQWVITLKPLRSGVLSIPAITIGKEQSNPMTINVETAASKQTTVQNNIPVSTDLNKQGLALKTSVDLTKPYVNQEIIYTVKLYNSKRLLDAEYQPPKAEDALIIPLGDAKRYQTFQNSTNYVVEEQKYAVFPQKSGTLTISSPAFTALVYDFNPQRITARDKALSVAVQPIPKQFQNKTWLPAKEVRLSEQYENASQSLSQGSTLVRTITLEGLGIPAQLLPNLTFSADDNFSVYPEKGTDRNQVRQGELSGSTEFKVTYLFNKAGSITLPEVRVEWFNTQTGTAEVTLLAPRSIKITAAPEPQNNTSPNNLVNRPPAAVTPAPEIAADTTSVHPLAPAPINYWPWLIAGFFACAWLSTIALGRWSKRSRAASRTAYKQALKQLKNACASACPQEARNALLRWAALHWPDASLLSLNELTQLVHDVPLKKQIHILSQVLYKKEGKALWRGDELFNAVHALKKPAVVAAGNKKNTVLPPINPL